MSWIGMLIGCFTAISAMQIPHDFVNIRKVDKSIQVELRYHSDRNFVGRAIDGYRANICYITKAAARQLIEVQKELNQFGLGLKIFDAYRPQSAVDHFVRWSKNPTDTLTKRIYYPKVPKSQLFQRGYIASRSGHSRGSTVDLTIIDLSSGEALDMGSPWDFFGPISWVHAATITAEQRAHRGLLNQLMRKHGFKPYSKEWWHFTLEDEPFPDTYFDFTIE